MSKDHLAFIIDHLKECFDGAPWYGDSMLKKLEAIDWHIVNDKIYGNKSIAVLLQHIINWRVFVFRKLDGDVDYQIKIDGPNDWTSVTIKTKSEWNGLISELRRTQNGILKILDGKDDAILNHKVPGQEYHFGPILLSIAQHDIYHLGQIAMLNAMHSK